MKVSKEMYLKLKEELEKVGVVVRWSSTNGKEYDLYFVNNYKQVIGGWGTDLQKELVAEFNKRDSQ